jgi:lipopolysaccharide heptosyltransferase II
MAMQRQAEWNNLKNILCLRLDNLGDILMTTPAIRALKECVDGRKITLLASSAGASIAKHIPDIDDIIIFDTPWEKNGEAFAGNSLNDIALKIRQRNFDAAVIFTVYSQNPLPAAMLCYMAGIPRVAGYCRENPYKLITEWLPDKEPLYEIKHEVVRQLDLVKILGASTENDSMSLSIPENSVKNIHKKLAGLGINLSRKSVIIHPGVSEPKRQFPVTYFAESAKKIIKELGCQVIITGVTSEKALADHIAGEAGENAFSLAGLLNIEELISLIKYSMLLIANNTGPVHIASAVGTPVVVLYALTNPQHAPWNVSHKILPFDVPQEIRSKNTIISFANEKAFKSSPMMVGPEEILKAVKELILQPGKVNKTEVLYL